MPLSNTFSRPASNRLQLAADSNGYPSGSNLNQSIFHTLPARVGTPLDESNRSLSSHFECEAAPAAEERRVALLADDGGLPGVVAGGRVGGGVVVGQDAQQVGGGRGVRESVRLAFVRAKVDVTETKFHTSFIQSPS